MEQTDTHSPDVVPPSFVHDFAGAKGTPNPWELYDRLIEGIPEGIAVKDACIGSHWVYVDAECGMGVSFSAKGGAKPTGKADPCAMSLRDVAALSKSWNFPEASLGIAALNAWYAQKERLDLLGAVYDDPIELPDGSIRKVDAFERFRDEYAGRNVTIVGHFPHIERVAAVSPTVVLERSCTSAEDTPDPACEYVIPASDFLFVTGVTLINKTAPRLLQLARDARTVFVGPSVVMSAELFAFGADVLAGSCVLDPERTAYSVKTGAGQLFGKAIQMLSVSKDAALASYAQ